MTRIKFLYKNEVFRTIRSVSDTFSIPYGKLCHKLNEVIMTDTKINTIDITQLVDNYRKFHNFNPPVLSVKDKHFKTYNSIAKFLHISEETAKRVTPENFDTIRRERLAKLQPIVINGKVYKRLPHESYLSGTEIRHLTATGYKPVTQSEIIYLQTSEIR